MKRLLKVLQNKSLNVLGCLALVIGAGVASSASALLLHQPQCPKDLIK
jgi:cyclic lactone autoinducer peptide